MNEEDVWVYKALFVKADKLKGSDFNKYYDNEILGYLIIWKCKYNIATQTFHSTTVNHKDIIETLPKEIKDSVMYKIRLDFLEDMPTLSVNPEGLDNDDLKYIGLKLKRGETNFK